MRQALTSDGVAVAYADLGGTGPPVLMAHATGFHAMVWQPLAEALAGDFRCVVFDARGHGDTAPRHDGEFHWQGFARDALAVVDGAGLDRPFGVGHSAGGAALLMAELARPGTFRALYCFEPVVFAARAPGAALVPPPEGNAMAAAARRRREVFASRDAAYEHYAAKLPLGALAPASLRAYVEHGFEDLADGTVRLKCRGESEARTYEMSTRHDTFDRLPEVGCPVTVACGADTTTFGPDVMALVADRLPHGRTEVLPGLGHFGPLEDPAGVAVSIRQAFAT